MTMRNGSVQRLRVALDTNKQLIHNTRSLRAQFIEAELSLALTFCQIAQDAGQDSEKRARNVKNAKILYESGLSTLSGLSGFEAGENLLLTPLQRSVIERLRTQVDDCLAALDPPGDGHNSAANPNLAHGPEALDA